MTARTLPNLGLTAFYDLGEDGWKDDQDLGLLKLSVLVQARALDKVAAEPGAPTLGDVVLLDETHATHPNEIAVWDGETGAEAWVYFAPNEGWSIYIESLTEYQQFDGAEWVSAGSATAFPDFTGEAGKFLRVNATEDGVEWADAASGAVTESLVIAIGDETTAITAGTAKVTFRMPYAFTLTSVRASLTVASSSGDPTVDINESGASILSTKLSIDSGEKTSTTATTAAVISDASLADDAEITIDIDTAGTGAAGLKVYLIGHQ